MKEKINKYLPINITKGSKVLNRHKGEMELRKEGMVGEGKRAKASLVCAGPGHAILVYGLGLWFVSVSICFLFLLPSLMGLEAS